MPACWACPRPRWPFSRREAEGITGRRLFVVERFYAAMGTHPLGESLFDAHGTPVREVCRRIEL